MSDFVVSARKYRPATFASVVGQGHITSTLRNAVERGQLAHAYLFCGPRGVGKTTCARIFAKTINCQAPRNGEACGECASCRSFEEGRSFNIHELDAASNNSVEDIRSLIEQVRIIPQEGRYSVFIIDEVHMLSQAAFNAFLKTLEEPPAHAVFILATTEKHKIIPTILSRCQIYDFNRIRTEDAVEYMKDIAAREGVDADDESLHLIAQKADGGMRDALSMFDKAVSFCGTQLRYREVARTLNVLDYDTYFTVVDLLLRGDYAAALVALDEVVARGFTVQTFATGLGRHLRDLLVAKDPRTFSLIEATGSVAERYRTQAAACDTAFLFGGIGLLAEIDGRIRQSSNQRLLVELGLMKLAGAGQKKNESLSPELPLPELPRGTNAAPAHPATATVPAGREESGSGVPTPRRAESEAAAAPPERRAEECRPGTEESQADAGRQTLKHRTEEPHTDTPVQARHSAAAPAAAGRRPLVSGTSLTDLLTIPPPAAAETETPANPAAPTTAADPQAQQKLEGARERILALLQRHRPRFVPAFEPMEISGNTLSITVPTEELRDEILRSEQAMLARIAQLAGVEGSVALRIEVKEEAGAVRPIKLEDRIRHMTERNPLLVELRKALDLEVE